ncbi:putative isxo2-like transposase domain protein [Trichonephila clavipes]|nr:putative isxo2-like transposase domain protein [Trichonephila clavipes]
MNKDNGTSLLLAWKPRTALFGKPPGIPRKSFHQYRPLKALPKLHIMKQTKCYDYLSVEGYVHFKINHSLTFVDPETGAHTNSIEGTWSATKKGIHKAHVKGQFDSYLAEYMWWRSNGHKLVDDNFHDFLASIAKVYPPPEKDETQA